MPACRRSSAAANVPPASATCCGASGSSRVRLQPDRSLMLIYGLNPVFEALRAGRVKELRVVARGAGRVADLIGAAERAGIPVRRVAAAELDRASRGGVHQGVVAQLEEAEQYDIADLV